MSLLVFRGCFLVSILYMVAFSDPWHAGTFIPGCLPRFCLFPSVIFLCTPVTFSDLITSKMASFLMLSFRAITPRCSYFYLLYLLIIALNISFPFHICLNVPPRC